VPHRHIVRTAAGLTALLVAAACGSSAGARRDVEARQARAVAAAPAAAAPAGAAAATPTPDASPSGAAAAAAGPAAAAPGSAAAPVTSSAGQPGRRIAAQVGSPGSPAPSGPAGTGVGAASSPAGGGPSAGGGPATPGTPGAGPGGPNLATDVGVTAESIKVGHIGILSGPVSAAGDDISWAGQATLAAANDAGGINGRKLDVKVRDDAWDGTKGMNAAKDLVEREKIFGFCCTMTVATTDPLAVYADEVKVPNVGPAGHVHCLLYCASP